MARLNGISERIANNNSLPAYFLKFPVWKYPSTIIKAKIGKEIRPMQVSQSFPGTIVPQRWSHSINTIAMMCNDMEDVSMRNLFSIKTSKTIGLKHTI